MTGTRCVLKKVTFQTTAVQVGIFKDRCQTQKPKNVTLIYILFVLFTPFKELYFFSPDVNILQYPQFLSFVKTFTRRVFKNKNKKQTPSRHIYPHTSSDIYIKCMQLSLCNLHIHIHTSI